MKSSSFPKILAMFCLGFLLRGFQASAADFDLLVTASQNPTVVGRPLTFTIDLTNRTGFAVTNVLVTNTFPASAILFAASNSFTTGGTLTNAGLIILQIDDLTNDQPARISFSILPTVLGQLTNTTMVNALGFTNVTTTNVTTTVVSGIADLVAGITGPPAGVLINDSTTYSVSATNFGPDDIPKVVLTNTLPPNAKLLSVNPTNATVTFTNGNLLFSLGTLPGSTFSRFQVTIQPTNAGDLTIRAQVGAVGAFDTNADNNFASNTFTVSPFLGGQLVASISSTQKYNPQTGLMEQLITLSNTGATSVASARVIVQGLTNRLYNAVGTNDSHPFVVYANTLAAGASVNLLLEYFIPKRLPVPDPTLVAVEVPVVNVTTTNTAGVDITKIVRLPAGSVLIEFPSVPGQTYTILYSDTSDFATTLVAQPSIVAPADRVQWIDDGPPKTISNPTNAPTRFYRVVLNP